MARGTIPDDDIKSSSVLNSDSYASNARLGNTKAWKADTSDRNPWIKVNLQQGRNITAITTQGFQDSYVTRYYLSYGDDGKMWMNYTYQGILQVRYTCM